MACFPLLLLALARAGATREIALDLGMETLVAVDVKSITQSPTDLCWGARKKSQDQMLEKLAGPSIVLSGRPSSPAAS